MTDRTHPEAGSTHIIRYALELGLLWIDGSGRGKVREALDALDILEAELEAVGAGGVQALSAAPAEQQVASSAVLKAIREANMQLVRTGDDAFMLVPYKRATAEQQAAPKAAPWELAASATKDAIMGAAYDFRDAHISGSMNLKRSAHAILEAAVDNALAAQAAPQQEAQEPYAYAVYFPDQPKVELVHDLDELIDDLTNRQHTITKLYTAPQPAPAPLSDDDVRDAAFEAVRKKLCALPRFSFLSDRFGVRRVPDKSGSWIAFDDAHELFDPVAVDAALAAQGGK